MPLSNFTITLGKSSYYLRLACLLHVFAIVVLWHSSLPIYALSAMLFSVIGSFAFIARCSTPVPAYNQLSRHTNHWLLHETNGRTIRYEQAQISFDGGLFLLLTLSGENTTKKLVIFIDQLTNSQSRALHIIGKIKPAKK